MHHVLALICKLVISVVFVQTFLHWFQKDVNDSRPHVLNEQPLFIIPVVVLAIFRLKPFLYVFNVILLHLYWVIQTCNLFLLFCTRSSTIADSGPISHHYYFIIVIQRVPCDCLINTVHNHKAGTRGRVVSA